MEESVDISEGIQKINEYGFREVESTDQSLALDREDLPWLPDKNEHGEPQVGIMVPLALVTLAGGEKFYCGSAIKGNALVKEAEKLGNESEKANKLFYSTIQRHINGDTGINVLDNSVTKTTDNPRKIFYSSNGRGAVRTYYMHMGEREERPVFLRVGTCSGKGSEVKVLSVLTTQDTKALRKSCLGK